MHRKLMGAMLALAAFGAFVLPAAASAFNNPHLTHNFTLVGAGKKIRATQVGSSQLQETGGTTLWTCTSGEMTGEVTKNENGTVEGKITSAGFSGTAAGKCTGGFAVLGRSASVTPKVSEAEPWCVGSTPLMAEHEWQLTRCGGGRVTFIMDVTEVGECKYEATGVIKGTYTTESTGDAILTVTSTSAASGFTLEPGSAGVCKTSAKLNMAFTLETDESKAEPLTIS